MKKVLAVAVVLLAVGAAMGTVLPGQVANAAAALGVTVLNDNTHPVPVAETNLDPQGNIKVHEHGSSPTTTIWRSGGSPGGFGEIQCFNEEIVASNIVLSASQAGGATESMVRFVLRAGGTCGQGATYTGGRETLNVMIALGTTVSIPLTDRIAANRGELTCVGTVRCGGTYTLIGRSH
jgi:hypothetical protein